MSRDLEKRRATLAADRAQPGRRPQLLDNGLLDRYGVRAIDVAQLPPHHNARRYASAILGWKNVSIWCLISGYGTSEKAHVPTPNVGLRSDRTAMTSPKRGLPKHGASTRPSSVRSRQRASASLMTSAWRSANGPRQPNGPRKYSAATTTEHKPHRTIVDKAALDRPGRVARHS